VTILEAIQQATGEVTGIVGLSFANLQEFNAFKQSFEFSDWPRNIVVPPVVNGEFRNNRVKQTLVLRGWVLTRIAQDTDDWRSVQLEPAYIDPMRQNAIKFLRKMLNTDIVDPEREIVTFTVTPEYMFLDNHVFGVSYSCNVPLVDHVC
jgi:hypothetical protein